MGQYKKSVPLDDWMAERDRDVAARAAAAAARASPHRKPLTKNHLYYQQTIEAYPVTVCVGPCGTGKTVLACEVAAKLFREQKIKRIVLSRPLVMCDEDLGTLPGSKEEKLAPFLAPLENTLKGLFGRTEYDRMVANGVVEVCPLAVMRGRTFEDAVVILDESQNATYGQLKMALTRLGGGSHIVVNGDVTQSDLRDPDNPLTNVIRRLRGVKEIKIVRLTRADVLRPALVQLIDERLS